MATLETTPLSDEDAMALALVEARAASEEGEVPVGAVALIDGKVVAARHNEREGAADPTAHAEILALRDAASAVGGWRLAEVTLVVTLEPCPMCAGALVAARVRRVVFGASDPRAGACGTLYNLCSDPRLSHELELTLRVGNAPRSPGSRFPTRSERLASRPEECESGRIGRSRKPLCLMGTVGSNPTSSARGRRGPPHTGGCGKNIGRAGALPAGPGRSPAAGKE